jgi:WD40 repeat protein
MAQMSSSAIGYCRLHLRKVGLLAVCAGGILILAYVGVRESIRAELIRMQKQTGLSLVSIRDNKIYRVDFAVRGAVIAKKIASRGTVTSGAISDDGTKIAANLCREPGFTHPTPNETACPSGDVFSVMRLDGSDAREYRESLGSGFGYCWSHDGTKVVLQTQNKLQIFDLAMGSAQTIAGYDAFVDSQCWSRDDKKIVYTANNTVYTDKVAVYEVETKTSHDFSRGTRATWSPDGNWIAVMDCPPSLYGCSYFAVRPSGTERKLLFKSESATSLWWSPDSRYVAYVNGAALWEAAPWHLFEEMRCLRVRRIEDNSVASFADFFAGDTMDFQWVKTSALQHP